MAAQLASSWNLSIAVSVIIEFNENATRWDLLVAWPAVPAGAYTLSKCTGLELPEVMVSTCSVDRMKRVAVAFRGHSCLIGALSHNFLPLIHVGHGTDCRQWHLCRLFTSLFCFALY